MVTTLQKTQTLYWSSTPSACGTCVVIANADGVCWTGTPGATLDEGLAWLQRKMPIEHLVEGEEVEPLKQAMDELRRYFAGERLQFTCALDMRGTPFQISVWQAMLRIPYGETRTYGELAHEIGRPSAPRAVGAAGGANPIAIIVPCHRVIGSNGSLTGYGGGLPTKEWLLDMEKRGTRNIHS